MAQRAPFVEFATTGFFPPFTSGAKAAEAEAMGYDVQMLGVNDCLTPDVFNELRLAAEATSTIKIMTGLANMVTRHPSVIASGMAAVQIMSGGRAICGVGKGDSSVGMIGLKPQPQAEYVRDAALVRAYLRGETTRINDADSRLRWLPEDYEPVPLEMFASGPKSIAAAAAIADRVTLAVGANPEYMAWALDIIDRSLAESGRTRADIQIGATIPFAVADDAASAREALRPHILGWAHMSSFRGNDLSRQPEPLRKVTEVLRTAYSYDHHTIEAARTSKIQHLATDEFIDWFGIAGTADGVAGQLLQLWDMGLRHFTVATDDVQRARLAKDVMPRVRAEVAARAHRAV